MSNNINEQIKERHFEEALELNRLLIEGLKIWLRPLQTRDLMKAPMVLNKEYERKQRNNC